MDPYERQTLSDAFQDEKFMAGDLIIKQGDEGNKFYFVEEGSVKVSINTGSELKEMTTY
jgi:cAMP-dependent protein kinase regulator